VTVGVVVVILTELIAFAQGAEIDKTPPITKLNTDFFIINPTVKIKKTQSTTTSKNLVDLRNF
jgi:hypothetical protein